jgi:NADH-quinone oxidoreductase subunit L
MSDWMLLLPVIAPAVLAGIIFLVPKRLDLVKSTIALVGTTLNLIFSIFAFSIAMSGSLVFTMAWGGFGIDLSLKLYQFSGFIMLAVSGFAFLIALYSMSFMRKKESQKPYYAYLLLTVSLVTGAVLANNLIVMLFFWEALLVTLFGMIMTGGKKAFPTAVKALVISGVADLCLMLGVGLTVYLAGSSSMDQIQHLNTDALGAFAFIMIMIGAIAKAGSMPFHSWIPDAAVDAPLPFMAFLPASLEKLLGIYLLARVSLDFYTITPGSWLSTIMMTIGVVTIIFAVLMALIQKDYKRLLSYHAISQVGYMILGIGTALPIGIVGGLFHMINHAMYKSGLFLTAGSVERAAGTTDLKQLGGLGARMPVTFICFIITAAAISGVPPFNGFYSKELVFEAARESGMIFYIVALLGAFFTAASFLKLGHAAFLGKRSENNAGVKESKLPMTIPMVVIAAGCLLFGVYNQLPLQNLIQPILGDAMHGHDFAGFLPHNWLLAGISVGVLLFALLNHLFGVKRTGSGLGAVDHIHHAPGLHTMYNLAEKRYFDPYDIGLVLVKGISLVLYRIDRGIDWVYEVLAVKTADGISRGIRMAHTGNQSLYILWSFVGVILIAILMVSKM